MNRNHLLLLFILTLLTPVCLVAQVKLKGRITGNDDQPREFTEVILLSKDSIALKSELTDRNGLFQVEEQTGEYLLQVKYAGKILHSRYIQLQQDTDLGTIKVSALVMMPEARVVGKKNIIERKTDRLIFNVEQSITASGGDALDALKATPGVRVQNNQVIMIGKSGMSVMIDDRPVQFSGDELINFLKAIRSDDIKSIEVIANPPAQYDAEGNSGIINIRLKKAKKDLFSGTLRTSYTQSRYALGSTGATLNYQKDKWTLTSGITYTNGGTGPYQEYTISYPAYTWFEISNRRNLQNSLSGRLSADYRLTPKTTVSVQYAGVLSRPVMKSTNTSNIGNKNLNETDSVIVTPARIDAKRVSHTVNIHTLTKLDSSGKTISFDADYLSFMLNLDNRFSSGTYLPNGAAIPGRSVAANNLSVQDIQVYSSRVDVQLPAAWADISFGGKVSFIDNNSHGDYFNTISGSPVFDASKSNAFRYKENMQALYISGSKKLSPVWDMQLGLRLEATQTTGISATMAQKNRNNYTRLFPTFYLTRKTGEAGTLALNYNRRISRPAYNNLNPFRFYTSAYNYSQGNPFLQPSFTHNADISYAWKTTYTSVYLNYTTDGYDQVTLISPGSTTQVLTPYNFYTKTTIGFIESYTFSKWKKWESNNQLNGFYTRTKSRLAGLTPELDGFTASINTNNSFIFNKAATIRGEINFMYQSPSVAGSYKLSGFASLDAGMRFFLLKKKLQLSVNGLDILKTNKLYFTQVTNGVKQRIYDFQDTQKIRVALAWNFGKALKTDKRENSNEDEKRRTN